MIYNISINQIHCIKNGLNIQQGALMYLLSICSTWATPIVSRNEQGENDGTDVHFWLSKGKIVEELPLAYKTTNAAYKGLVSLRDLELIEYKKVGQKDVFRFTEAGKEFARKIADTDIKNIEDGFLEMCEQKKINRIKTKLGKKSESLKLGKKSELTRKKIRINSEKNPTDNNTSDNGTNNNDNNNNKIKSVIDKGFKISSEKKEEVESYGFNADILVKQFVAYNKQINSEQIDWLNTFNLFLYNKAQKESNKALTKQPEAVKQHVAEEVKQHVSMNLDFEIELRLSAVKNGKVFIDGYQLPPLPKMRAGESCSFLEANRNGKTRTEFYHDFLISMQ